MRSLIQKIKGWARHAAIVMSVTSLVLSLGIFYLQYTDFNNVRISFNQIIEDQTYKFVRKDVWPPVVPSAEDQVIELRYWVSLTFVNAGNQPILIYKIALFYSENEHGCDYQGGQVLYRWLAVNDLAEQEAWVKKQKPDENYYGGDVDDTEINPISFFYLNPLTLPPGSFVTKIVNFHPLYIVQHGSKGFPRNITTCLEIQYTDSRAGYHESAFPLDSGVAAAMDDQGYKFKIFQYDLKPLVAEANNGIELFKSRSFGAGYY